MRSLALRVRFLLLLAAAWPCVAGAQSISLNYDMTRPMAVDADLLPGTVGAQWGPVRITSAFSPYVAASGGLSLETGSKWFGRLTVGRSAEVDMLAIGGGYRWQDGDSVSLQLSRGRGQERLGLAVRHDWQRYYLRLAFDPKPYEGAQDMLRFSAGMRF